MDHSVTCSHTQKKGSYYFQVPFSKRKHEKLIEELGERSAKAEDAKAAKTFFLSNIRRRLAYIFIWYNT